MSRFSLFALASVFGLSACAGGGRALIVKSEPADADVCIKGKADSDYFSNQKSCVGTTPFEADKVDVTDPGGSEKHTVRFKDVEKSKESFYVVVSRQGYASQAVEVPGWDHAIVLKPEGVAAAPAPAPSAPAEAPVSLEPGTVHIASDPMGALVYIDGELKGNTPYTHEGAAGKVRLKLELEGYSTLEKVLTVEPKGNLTVNFKMLSSSKAAGGTAAAATPASAAALSAPATPAPAVAAQTPSTAPLNAEPITPAPPAAAQTGGAAPAASPGGAKK